MWNRGDDIPTNEVTLFTRSSFISMADSESATLPVSSIGELAAMCISTAKLSRSAFGSICMLICVKKNTPTSTSTRPVANVPHLWRKQNVNNFWYPRCSQSKNPFCIRSIHVVFRSRLIRCEARNGITSTAYRKLQASAISIVHGNSPTKSPSMLPLSIASAGKNIIAIEAVANSIDTASFFVDTAAEYHRECPARSRSV